MCTLYSDRDEQLAAAVNYLRGGLERGERCLYVCCEHSPDEFRAGLRAAGIDVAGEEARGALLLLTKREAHLAGGCFDPDKMITMLHGAVKDALDAGFSGLCAAGDMSWLLDEADGSDRIAEYEARLNAFYPSSRALGLCLYNRTKLPAATLDHCMATHPHVRIDGNLLLDNPFYEEPGKAAFRRTDGSAMPKKLEWLKTAIASFFDGGGASEPATVPLHR
ncbi:MAG: MEDS domain-containing protein [Acidobacteria bacterium]|nr:MEDS domain-containing protein [Acidobacteriota bacterium]MBV9475771.1 MEDS domain-containing protein [Acidobacteriota bacterium]